ncbi:MAG: hypothetical protein IT385_29875 [Deltaproteobacteria bacterium]|nr:hypothetical protein [Deltaproteobacteria bacterium]
MRRSLIALLVAPLVASACPSSQRAPDGEEPAPAPAGRSDLSIEIPESGFWNREAPGRWMYDLGVGLTSDVQLTAPGRGRGLVRVPLPPGATGAKMRALTVMWAKNHADMPEDPGAASGTGVWHIHADEGGKPGRELGVLSVQIDDANAAPLDDANDGSRYALPTPVEVPATFWLVFERTSGDPRIGAMRLLGDFAETYKNLYYLETPDAPLGEPKNLRPYIAIEFEDLGR